MREVPSRWAAAVLVCQKCSKRVGGGFGEDGRTGLAKALRRHLGLKKGRKAAAGVVEVKCLGLCPKRQVVAVSAAQPGRWKLVEPGADLEQVARALGLTRPHPSAASPLPPSPAGRGKGPATEGGGQGEGGSRS